jgi:hypothetical protein
MIRQSKVLPLDPSLGQAEKVTRSSDATPEESQCAAAFRFRCLVRRIPEISIRCSDTAKDFRQREFRMCNNVQRLAVQNCRLRAVTFWACWRRPRRGKSSSVTPPLSNCFRWRARLQPITPHQKAARVLCCTTQGKK